MSNEELNAVTDSTTLMNQELHNVPEKMIQQNDQQTPKQPILKVKDQKNNGDTNIQSINKVESSNGKSKKDI